MKKNYGRTKLACYLGFITQAISANFAPLLYITFHDSYGISFAQLALISMTFFLTQMAVDFICAKVVDRIGYRKCVVASEVTSMLGLVGLAFLPDLLPSPYVGILLSTVIYAIGSGLIEVLVSPIIEACPFENKEGTMSLLHSFYCWGVVGVILGTTLFFRLFGVEHWRIIACVWALVPLYNIYNFVTCPMETLVEEGKSMTLGQLFKTKIFWVLLLLMVGAGASEISMSQWASAFAESALHVSKSVGDLAGPCCFAVFQGISRVFYGKYGEKVDLTGFMIGSGVLCLGCYLLAGLANLPILGLIGCGLCGFAVGIMWPGSISIASATLPMGGTALFAMLALAGDLGGSLGPGIVGTVSQSAGENLKAGVLAGIGFPVLLVACLVILVIRRKKEKAQA